MQIEFEIAENGQVAVQKSHEQTYDLILMDGRMPVMDGFEAPRERGQYTDYGHDLQYSGPGSTTVSEC